MVALHGKRFWSGCTTINAPRRASLRDHDLAEQWQLRFQPFPYPHGDVFAGRVFQAGNIVEVTVIELFPKRFKGIGNVGIIHQPAKLRIAFAGDNDLGLETVAVQTAALVRRGQVRQQVRRFKLEAFPQLDFHFIARKGFGERARLGRRFPRPRGKHRAGGSSSEFLVHCSQSVQVTRSPRLGRPSCRQVNGGFCIWPMAQMRVAPQCAHSVAIRSPLSPEAANPTVET